MLASEKIKTKIVVDFCFINKSSIKWNSVYFFVQTRIEYDHPLNIFVEFRVEM